MAVTTTLAPSTTLSGAPGKVVGCDVVLVNHGDAGEVVDVEVVGPPAAWVLVWPSRLSLPPGGEGRTRLAFTVPHAPPATVSFGVRVVGSAVAAADVQGTIEIAAVQDLRLVVRPMMARARRTSRHTVTVENRGNVAAGATVAAATLGDAVAVELSAGSVSMAPGEEASLAMVVAVRRRSWARATRTHRLCVGATVDGRTAATAESVFFQEPLRWRPPALAAVALLVAALLVWRTGGEGTGAGTEDVAAGRVAVDRGPSDGVAADRLATDGATADDAGRGAPDRDARPALAPATAPVPTCPTPVTDGAPTVVIATFAFCPSPITVARGTEVAWRNDDAAPHTVTSSEPGSFDSGVLARGQSFRTNLEMPGIYEYVCTLHPGMRGAIVVTG